MGALTGVPIQRIVEGDAVERELWLRVTRRSDALMGQVIKAQAAHNAAQISQLFRRRG